MEVVELPDGNYIKEYMSSFTDENSAVLTALLRRRT